MYHWLWPPLAHPIPQPLLLSLSISHPSPSNLVHSPTTFYDLTLKSGQYWPIQFYSHFHCHFPFPTHDPLNFILTFVATSHFSPTPTHHSFKFSNHLHHNSPQMYPGLWPPLAHWIPHSPSLPLPIFHPWPIKFHMHFCYHFSWLTHHHPPLW